MENVIYTVNTNFAVDILYKSINSLEETFVERLFDEKNKKKKNFYFIN